MVTIGAVLGVSVARARGGGRARSGVNGGARRSHEWCKRRARRRPSRGPPSRAFAPGFEALTVDGAYARDTPPPRRARADHPRGGAILHLSHVCFALFCENARRSAFPLARPIRFIPTFMKIESARVKIGKFDIHENNVRINERNIECSARAALI